MWDGFMSLVFHTFDIFACRESVLFQQHITVLDEAEVDCNFANDPFSFEQSRAKAAVESIYI